MSVSQTSYFETPTKLCEEVSGEFMNADERKMTVDELTT